MHVGIDGGASNTRVKLIDREGRVRTASVPKHSSLTLGVEAAWSHIGEALAAVGVEDGDGIHLACALAGSRRVANQRAFYAGAPGFASVTLCSDGHAGVLGAHGGGAGAAVSIGTGIVGNCVTAAGEARQVGGWGFPVRDEASGAWLGCKVLAEALRVLDGYPVEATALHAEVLAAVGGTVDAISDWTFQAPSTRYATLAPLVAAAAAKGDAAGLRLMRLAAAEVALVVDALDPGGSLPLCLAGSLAGAIVAASDERIRARVQPSRGDACDGALLLAQGRARSDLDVVEGEGRPHHPLDMRAG